MEDRIQAHLRSLAGQLAGFLHTHLNGRGGDDWWDTRVVQQLTYGQQGQVRSRGITTLAGLDLAALLRVYDRNWSELDHLAGQPNEVRTLARQLMDLRHALAHQGAEHELPPADAYRHLETLHRFLQAIAADPAVLAEVGADRDKALAALAVKPAAAPAPPEQPAPEPAPKATKPEPSTKAPPPDAGPEACRVGPLAIHGPGESEETQIRSFGDKVVPATAIPWQVRGPGGLAFLVKVLLIDDEPGEGEEASEFGQVFCESRLSSPVEWDQVVRRLRVGIRPTESGHLTVDLRAAMPKPEPGHRAGRKVLSLQQLEELLELDPAAVLQQAGALAVGTRQEVLQDQSKNRGWPCITFERNDLLTPVAAFVLTTLLPLLKQD